MSNVSALAAVRDANFEIDLSQIGTPEAPAGGFQTTFGPFDLPGLTAGPGILYFRLKPTGRTRLDMTFNGQPIVTHQMNTTPSRTFHEILASTQLRPSANRLTVSITADVPGEGEVVLSDIAVLYTVEV